MRKDCRANSSPERSRNCLNYFGTLASRVRIVYVDFHTETWKFGGMPSAVMHNELAPGQHEILPIFALMACLGKARKARRPSPRVFFWNTSFDLSCFATQTGSGACIVIDQAVDDPRSKNPLNEHQQRWRSSVVARKHVPATAVLD